MRRRFNQAILPKHPPKKGQPLKKPEPIGSPFNQWFRATLEQLDLDAARFSRVSGQPYATVRGWMHRHNPQCWGQCRIARAFEKLGIGKYTDLRSKIEKLCASK